MGCGGSISNGGTACDSTKIVAKTVAHSAPACLQEAPQAPQADDQRTEDVRVDDAQKHHRIDIAQRVERRCTLAERDPCQDSKKRANQLPERQTNLRRPSGCASSAMRSVWLRPCQFPSTVPGVSYHPAYARVRAWTASLGLNCNPGRTWPRIEMLNPSSAGASPDVILARRAAAAIRRRSMNAHTSVRKVIHLPARVTLDLSKIAWALRLFLAAATFAPIAHAQVPATPAPGRR